MRKGMGELLKDKIRLDASYGAPALVGLGCRSTAEEQLESWTPDGAMKSGHALKSGHAARSPCFSMFLGQLSLQILAAKERKETQRKAGRGGTTNLTNLTNQKEELNHRIHGIHGGRGGDMFNRRCTQINADGWTSEEQPKCWALDRAVSADRLFRSAVFSRLGLSVHCGRAA